MLRSFGIRLANGVFGVLLRFIEIDFCCQRD